MEHYGSGKAPKLGDQCQVSPRDVTWLRLQILALSFINDLTLGKGFCCLSINMSSFAEQDTSLALPSKDKGNAGKTLCKGPSVPAPWERGTWQ